MNFQNILLLRFLQIVNNEKSHPGNPEWLFLFKRQTPGYGLVIVSFCEPTVLSFST